MILGIDEVGRGPWAGPLVVGAVVLPEVHTLDGLTDSKKLTAKKRSILNDQIKSEALGWGLGWVPAEEIDKVGLSAALKLATIRAVEAVAAPYHEIIIDGTINFLKETNKGRYVTTLPKADLLVPAVSAASIIAKVARDTYMEEQGLIYPGYGFESHVGYGTARHSAALKDLGVTPLHRKSFAPIAKLLTMPINTVTAPPANTAKAIGNAAETTVANHLKNTGYNILDRNWKTKYCEIDITAERNGVTYFVEVKYRSGSQQGGGLAAITPKKLQQMKFAAEMYIKNNPTTGDVQLMAAIVDVSQSVELLEVL